MTDLKDRGHPAGIVPGRPRPKVVLCPTCADSLAYFYQVEEYSNPVEYSIARECEGMETIQPNGINQRQGSFDGIEECREYPKLEASPTYSSTEATLKKSRHDCFWFEASAGCESIYDPDAIMIVFIAKECHPTQPSQS